MFVSKASLVVSKTSHAFPFLTLLDRDDEDSEAKPVVS